MAVMACLMHNSASGHMWLNEVILSFDSTSFHKLISWNTLRITHEETLKEEYSKKTKCNYCFGCFCLIQMLNPLSGKCTKMKSALNIEIHFKISVHLIPEIHIIYKNE